MSLKCLPCPTTRWHISPWLFSMIRQRMLTLSRAVTRAPTDIQADEPRNKSCVLCWIRGAVSPCEPSERTPIVFLICHEVFDYLRQYGKIERVFKVTSSKAKFQHTAIVDQNSGGAIEYLKVALPVDRPVGRAVHGRQRFHLNSNLPEWTEGCCSASGADFEMVLLDEIARTPESTKPKTTESGIGHESQHVSPAHIADTTPTNVGDNQSHSHERDSPSHEVVAAVLSPHKNSIQYLPCEHLSTPEIQKVEHVSKNSDLPLRYDGNIDSDPSQVESPVPVQSLITICGAATLSFSLQTLPCLPHMVESLFLLAATIIKHLGPNASPHQ